jgi:hypothetical protein
MHLVLRHANDIGDLSNNQSCPWPHSLLQCLTRSANTPKHVLRRFHCEATHLFLSQSKASLGLSHCHTRLVAPLLVVSLGRFDHNSLSQLCMLPASRKVVCEPLLPFFARPRKLKSKTSGSSHIVFTPPTTTSRNATGIDLNGQRPVSQACARRE